MSLTRRTALSGTLALAAASMLPPPEARSAAPLANKQAPGFYRYNVGDVQVNVVSDGASTMPLPDKCVLNASRDDVGAALEQSFLPGDKVTVPYGPLVINSGSKLIVIDTGSGPGALAQSKGAIGQFVTNLRAAGFDPAAIDTVVISHFHGDHVNGLLDADNQPVFANAEVLVPHAEWTYWMDDGEMSRASGERLRGQFLNARRVFEAGLKKKVTPYEWGREVVPGLLAIESVGHTPGHTSYVLSSRNEAVFIQSDVTNIPALFVRHPDWHVMYDQDPEQAETTRRRVYDMLAAERMKVQGFHFPFPANGYVEKHGAGYRLVPAPWNPVI
jgi:glyoxylase-like metal-dependent hydrolase (beta-lactamase superfamily II)